MRVGVDYYPEQWSPSMWTQDADKMQEIGVEIVRLGEFAWSRMEPEEGVYDFAWLDKVVSIFTDRNIEVVLCTPTCTPPLWAMERYPEIIMEDANGNKVPIGVRGHRCVTNRKYRQLCKNVITQLVQRYKYNPGIIAYQLDNEIESNQCQCGECREGFVQWMQKKYKKVANINKAYGNSVWSGEYSDWSQVKPPTKAVLQWQNPSLTLDYQRYASDSVIEYICFQKECIREIDANVPITTNHWFCESMPDFYELYENLDFVSYDNYPVSVLPTDKETLYSHAFHLDLMRGIKQQNFWIMEQLSGAMGSWMPMSPTPRPGMIHGYGAQAFAHGADTVLYFRWRTACSGAEMYWHGILDHHNQPGRRFEEFAQLCQWGKQWKAAEGAKVRSEVAILYGPEQEYAFKLQHQAEGMYYLEQLKSFHDAFTALGIGVDIVEETASLEGYRMVAAPTLLLTKEIVKQHLYEFVQKGGQLFLTNRCGVKDQYNCCNMEVLPAGYETLAGVQVVEYDVIGTKKQMLDICQKEWQETFCCVKSKLHPKTPQEHRTLACTQWCDILKPTTATVLATYCDGEEAPLFYRGQPAVTCNAYGAGRTYYVGTVLERSGYLSLVQYAVCKAGVDFYENLPLGVEISVREKGQDRWTFVFNNTMQPQRLEKEEMIQPFEMKVYHIKNSR